MLFELRSAEPELVEVQTWNAQANEPMLKVNAELGFRPDREWCEYERRRRGAGAPLQHPDLSHHFSTRPAMVKMTFSRVSEER